MSYTITCFCNDETIQKTSVYISYLGDTYSGTYGSSSLGDYEEFEVGGLDSSWSATFSVTPATDCSFYRWVYRVGSDDATVQYDYNSTFTYTGGQDIYIRAEGTQSGSSGGGDTTGAELSIIGIGETNVSLQIINLDDSYDGSIRTIHIEAWEDPFVSNYFSPVATYDGTLENGVDSSDWILITGLDAGVRYRFACTISNIDNYDDVTLITYATTKTEDLDEGLPVIQSFYFYEEDKYEYRYSLEITLDSWNYDTLWEIYVDGQEVAWGTDRVVNDALVEENVYFSVGTHLAELKVYNEKGMTVKDYIFETNDGRIRPTDFNWWQDKTYENSFNALCTCGETTEFSAYAWNGIFYKLQSFLYYRHLDNIEIGPNNYGIAEDTLLYDVPKEAKISTTSTGDKTLYARKFNILRYLIEKMNTFDDDSYLNSIKNHYLNTGRWDFNSGEKVMGEYILDLVDYMNSIE